MDAPQDHAMPGLNEKPQERRYSIGEVIDLLKQEFPDLTVSKIRFLESQGLISPERTPAGYRSFSLADIEQLKWILTQQRDTYLPLSVIREKLLGSSQGGKSKRRGRSQPIGARTPLPIEGAPRNETPYSGAPRDAPGAAGTLGSEPAEQLPTGASPAPALVEEAREFGLLGPGHSESGSEQLLAALSMLARHGIRPRHLQFLRFASQRCLALVRTTLEPYRRRGTPDAKREARILEEHLMGALKVLIARLLEAAGESGLE